LPEIPGFSRLACLPRDAFYEAGERLPLLDDDGLPNPALNGRVCCDQVVPYPPGIPVLVPGQVIEANIVAYMARLLKTQKSIEMHGLDESGGDYCVRVLRDDELAELPSRSWFN
jgi:arginine decarboxylase